MSRKNKNLSKKKNKQNKPVFASCWDEKDIMYPAVSTAKFIEEIEVFDILTDDKVDEPKYTHVDEFIDYGTSVISSKREAGEDYARWLLNHFRMSAMMRMAFDTFMTNHELYAQYEGKTYRVIGASRMGDVWLTDKFENTHGYQHRVEVTTLSKWSDSCDAPYEGPQL